MPAVAALVAVGFHGIAGGACVLSDIRITSMQARFVDACTTQSCPAMRGAAVLTNACANAIGVQVKIVGLDSSGTPIAVHTFWPASVSNIAPGDYSFSLDHQLEYDRRIKRYTLEPVSVKSWRPR